MYYKMIHLHVDRLYKKIIASQLIVIASAFDKHQPEGVLGRTYRYVR